MGEILLDPLAGIPEREGLMPANIMVIVLLALQEAKTFLSPASLEAAEFAEKTSQEPEGRTLNPETRNLNPAFFFLCGPCGLCERNIP